MHIIPSEQRCYVRLWVPKPSDFTSHFFSKGGLTAQADMTACNCTTGSWTQTLYKLNYTMFCRYRNAAVIYSNSQLDPLWWPVFTAGLDYMGTLSLGETAAHISTKANNIEIWIINRKSNEKKHLYKDNVYKASVSNNTADNEKP